MTDNTVQNPQSWEIWHARFDFSEGHGYKYRPVIVVGSRENKLLVIMITSSTNKKSLPHDCLLKDWQIEGLNKPSIARLDRIALIPYQYTGSAGRIGQLSKRDAATVKILLYQVLQEEELEEGGPEGE